MLFLLPEELDTLNKYRLNFHCLTLELDRPKAKQDLIKFLKKVYLGQAKDIEEFEMNYKTDCSQEERIIQTKEWLVKDNFYWKSTQDLLSVSYFPQELRYLRLLFKDVEEAIALTYSRSYQDPLLLKEVFLVIELSNKELEKLKNNEGNYVGFTSFVRAYSDIDYAKHRIKRETEKQFVLCRVQIDKPQNLEHDFGFWHDSNKEREGDENVYFNIHNLFKVGKVEDNQIILKYGAVA